MYGANQGTKAHQSSWLREREPERYLGMSKTANDFLSAFKANVDAWYADEISFEVFTERQRALHEEVRTLGGETEAQVRAGLLAALHS